MSVETRPISRNHGTPHPTSQASDCRPAGSIIVAVVTGTKAWIGAQDPLAGLSPNSVHSTHEGLLEDARPAAASVRAITEVISVVRTNTPLPSS